MNDVKPFITKQVHIRDIRPGDTVLHNGQQMTVGKTSLSRSEFMGLSLFGDTYQLGGKLVTVVCFPRFRNGKFDGYFR